MGKCTGLARGIPQDHLDQAGLQAQPGAAGRLLDGLPERIRRHGSHEVDALGDERRELGVRRAMAEEVGPDHDDDARPERDRVGDRAHGRVDIAVVGVEDLLELVDHDDVGSSGGPDRIADLHVEFARRRQDRDAIPAPLQSRHHARPHERRLPAAGCTGDRQERRACQAGERRGDVGVAAEELLGVGDAERLQSAVGARRARRARGVRRRERGVVTEDREFERLELIAEVDAELVAQALPCRADGAQRVRLATAAVQRGRE